MESAVSPHYILGVKRWVEQSAHSHKLVHQINNSDTMPLLGLLGAIPLAPKTRYFQLYALD
tara:strand:- start:215 stop:397 length:183 start_codon:yes stop_codon:yes gene_type:complete